MYMLHFSWQSSSSIRNLWHNKKSSQGADPFYWMRVILASNRGTLMEPENSVFQVQVDVSAYSLHWTCWFGRRFFPFPAVFHLRFHVNLPECIVSFTNGNLMETMAICEANGERSGNNFDDAKKIMMISSDMLLGRIFILNWYQLLQIWSVDSPNVIKRSLKKVVQNPNEGFFWQLEPMATRTPRLGISPIITSGGMDDEKNRTTEINKKLSNW